MFSYYLSLELQQLSHCLTKEVTIFFSDVLDSSWTLSRSRGFDCWGYRDGLSMGHLKVEQFGKRWIMQWSFPFFPSQLAPFRIGSFSTNVEFVVFECPQEGRKTMMYHQVKWKVKKHSFYFEKKYDIQIVIFNIHIQRSWNGVLLPKALLTHVQIITSLRSLLHPAITSNENMKIWNMKIWKYEIWKYEIWKCL